MGLAATQMRFLALTAKKSNSEYQGQQINQQRLNLANQSSNIYTTLADLTVPVPPNPAQYSSSGALSSASFENVLTRDVGGGAGYIYRKYLGYYFMHANTTNNINYMKSGFVHFITYSKNKGNITQAEADKLSLIYVEKFGVEVGDTANTQLGLSECIAAPDSSYSQDPTNLRACYNDFMQAAFGDNYLDDSVVAVVNLNVNPAPAEWVDFVAEQEQKSFGMGYDEAYLKYEQELAQYNAQMAQLEAESANVQQKDKKLELQLKRIDTEHSAIQTEVDAIKKVLDDNIESSFKTFS